MTIKDSELLEYLNNGQILAENNPYSCPINEVTLLHLLAVVNLTASAS